ncbi:hypothetical protein [Thiorhodospira sibirica]|uniref:hypothetical protein n=1 Tax=Thiorhodospira sibirica TaxID=154347 RepID=UPI001C8D5EF3|nr:hypothetical protein [Thiorhodospira sibirica]
MNHHPIDPKIDCVFKALLGAEDNRALLIHFLNANLNSALPAWMDTDEMRQAMSTLKRFSEKDRAYHAYQARQNYLREQRSIQRHLEELQAETEQLQAEAERRRVEAEQLQAEAEQARRREALNNRRFPCRRSPQRRFTQPHRSPWERVAPATHIF